MVEKVKKTILKHNMLAPKDHVILGFSGGADSCALLYVLKELQEMYSLELTAVHLNHLIRNGEAERDEEFVKSICEGLGIECFLFRIDTADYAKNNGLGLEEAGRELRYKCFNQILEKKNADKIAVAHNLNDQAETVLMRLIRGSGLGGLKGIPAIRENIIRPLIECSRLEIEGYLNVRNLPYVSDSTNFTSVYTRNNLRLNIIPSIEKEINPNFLETIKRSSEIFSCDDEYLEKIAETEFEKIVRREDGIVRIDKGSFSKLHKAIQLRIARICVKIAADGLKDFESGHFESVLNILELKSGKKYSLPQGLIVQNSYKDIIIYREFDVNSTNIDLKDGDFIELPEYNVYLSVSCSKILNIKNYENICTKIFNYDKIRDNLKLRTREAGDRIYVDKISGTKKIKDYFIDNKIEKFKRDKILLLACESDILWILDHRNMDNSDYLAKGGSKEIYIQLWRMAKDEDN